MDAVLLVENQEDSRGSSATGASPPAATATPRAYLASPNSDAPASCCAIR